VGDYVTAQGKAYCKMSYSDDGIIWTSRKVSRFDGANLKTIAYGNGRFIVAAGPPYYSERKNSTLAYSDDGIHWTVVPNAPAVRGIAYGNNRWVAGGELWYSRSALVAITNDQYVYDITNRISNAFWSRDGITWSSEGVTGLTNDFYTP